MNFQQNTYYYPDLNELKKILMRPQLESSGLEEKVNTILKEVKASGDEAVRKYNFLFDNNNSENLQVNEAEFLAAENKITDELKNAISTAVKNIQLFHELQMPQSKKVETMPGVECSYKYLPIEKVGLYIPGGSAPLFSTLLMLAIPAKIAGCKEIIVCTPAGENGDIHPAILFSAKKLGIEKVFKTGGVQAIGAMAFGTKSISAVYKIFGPGNQFVTNAKHQVSKMGVAIDMPAGPSELAVFTDESADADFVAADLLSQAEHGPDSQVVLVSVSENNIMEVQQKLVHQLRELSREGIAVQSLQHARFIIAKTPEKAFDILNYYAPEHLIIASDYASELTDMVINAGSVFIGHYSPESAGDYASGTNHTLPTFGYAKGFSGVGLDSFLRKVTFQKLSSAGLQNIGKTVETMAAAEGLDAHKNAVTIRLQKIENEIRSK